MLLTEYSNRSLRDVASDYYLRWVQTTRGQQIHNFIRRRRHQARYGVKSAFMFQVVELEVNSMCNRKCGYCPNSFAKRPLAYMEESLVTKIIDELGSIDFDGRVSYHFYGEPLLDKRLPGFVEYTKRHAPKSSSEIYSNGDFLTLDIFRDYLGRGLGMFLITQHDNLIPPNLQHILDNATAEERRHITIRLAKDRYMINRSGLITNLNVLIEPIKAPCDWPLTTMVVTIAGNVVLCCNDYFESEVIGNVSDKSLREVWTNEKFERFRRALSRGDRTSSKLCEECDYVPTAEHQRLIIPS
jgi:radical SAM protein with 4Fe4S-binding SPASM domain